MAVKLPIEYDLSPNEISMGTRWLTLRLKNIGTQPLTGLDIKLNSLDAYNILAVGSDLLEDLPEYQEKL